MIEIKTKTMPATPRSKKYPVGASVLHTSGGTTIMQGGGSGESVDIVKRDDIRSFTDANVLSALRALAEFISKKDDSDITAIVNYLNGLKIKGNHVNRLLLKDTEADVVSDTDVMSALRVLSEIAANNEDLKGKFLSKLNPDETKHLLRLLGGLYVENGIHTDTLEASGNISAQNISATETISGQDITASENITGKNVSATESVSGQSISATETISGKNITASETVSTQNVDATGTVSANMIDATETISGKNVLASESVAGENITASNTASGKNVTAKETISGKNATISQKTTTLNLLVQALANVYDLNVSHVATLFQTVIKDYISSELYTPGLTGSGMKLYKAVSGDWNLELDNLTVRKAMTIFELIISKIRAVNGGLVVSPANGKVKSVLLTNDIYRLEIEGDMMFVADDLVRCQTFAKTGTKYYWVRITSVSGQYIFINKTEFTSSVPAVGDDLVQFGNKTNAARQGVLYLTASEDGKPRFSVLNGVNSTDLTGKIKVILGCLDGITDTAFSADSQPFGYGLYSANVFLKGIFVLRNGKTFEDELNGQITAVQTAFEIREGVISSKVTEATTAATNAKKSETSASTSASTATTKATAAASSATSASGSASTATTKANAAASSATAAATSATNAKSSADSAAAKLTTITQKESSINQTASQISTKVTEITTKATQAATSAANAKTSETNAGTKATAAANSATTAGTKATAAANSATAAATSATNAAASLTSVTTKQSEINATAAQITLKVTEVTTKTTQATNAAELATAMSKGKMLYRDPTFKDGKYNGTAVYLGTGATRSYVAVTGCPNPAVKAMKIVATQFNTATDKRITGFYFANTSRANAVFVVRIIANIPTGRNLNVSHNSYGTGGATKWLTSTAGAGKWTEYACKVTCGASGTFSTLNYFALTGGAAPTAAAPVTWYVAYATVFDVTDVDDTPSREEIKSGMTITAGGISIFGKELSLAGKVTFSSLDSAAQSTINGKATPAQVATAKSEAISTAATDATTKANNAKSAAISTAATDATTKANNAKSAAISTAATDATTKANNAKTAAISTAATDATTKANNALTNARNDVAVKLGYTSYTDMVNKATAKQTIIDGGFIRTSLIKADDIVTSTLLATKIAATEITTGKLTVTTGAKIGGWNVEGNSLAIRDESEAKILVEPSGYRFLRINDTKGTLMSIRADGVTGIGIYTQNKSGTCLSMIAQTGGTAVESYGSHTFGQRAGETWNAPGVLWAGRIVSNGTIESYWGNG